MELNSKHHSSKLEWIENLDSVLFAKKKKNHKINFLNVKPKWIYGIRTFDILKCFAYHNDSKNRGTSEKILYIVSKVVVILLHKLEEQIHYREHKNEISSIVTSENNLVATGEFGNSPSIHIWDINTLKTTCIFSGHHKSDIYLLHFFKDEDHLISCSIRDPTPIYIFSIGSKSLKFTFHINGFIRGIVPIIAEVDE